MKRIKYLEHVVLIYQSNDKRVSKMFYAMQGQLHYVYKLQVNLTKEKGKILGHVVLILPCNNERVRKMFYALQSLSQIPITE